MATTTRVGGRAKAARRSAAAWAAEVLAWKRSGSTAREYARMQGISAATLLWWSSRGGMRAASARGSSSGRARGRAEPRVFLPVQVAARSADAPRIEAEIILAGGRRVRVAGALTMAELARLLEVVEGGGAC